MPFSCVCSESPHGRYRHIFGPLAFAVALCTSGCSSSPTGSVNPGNPDGGDAGPAATQDGGGTPNDGSAPKDASVDSSVSGPGAASLGGSDGITGTFGGKTYALTVSPLRVPQQTPTVLIGASSATLPPADSWGIRFRPALGTQTCTGSSGENDPAVSFRSTANLDLNGTTGATGACSITVTSLAPKFEGAFTATIVTGTGNLVVTDGYFRIAN